MPDWSAILANLLAWVLANPWTAFSSIVTVASLVCFGTPTPAPDSWLGRLYKVVEFLAFNFFRAKDLGGGPASDGEVLGNSFRKLAVPLLAIGLAAASLSACAVVAKPETQAQTVYAIEADYQLAQRAALAYVIRADADPAVEHRVKELEAAAYGSITAARQAVIAGDDPRLPAALAAADQAVGALATYLREKEILK